VPHPAGVFAGLFAEPEPDRLIERLWWLLKRTAIWNQHYPTFAGFKAALDGFFATLGERHAQLVSLITDHSRFIGVS
jgi:hypothetical protein